MMVQSKGKYPIWEVNCVGTLNYQMFKNVAEHILQQKEQESSSYSA